MALSPLNPWRPSGAGESQTLWCASGSPRESLSFLRRLPSCAHFAALGLLCGQGFAPCGRHFVPLTAQAIASLALRGGGSGGMTVAGLYISKSVELARHLYGNLSIPDVLTAGIRDNGNLARVYSAGESWGWGIGGLVSLSTFEATSSCHRPSALFPLLIGFPFPFL